MTCFRDQVIQSEWFYKIIIFTILRNNFNPNRCCLAFVINLTSMRTRLLLLAILLLYGTLLTSIAQKDLKPGFIIRNQIDTISGYIDLGSNVRNSNECRFYNAFDSELTIFTPDDIDAYRIENLKYYVSKNVVIDGVPQVVFLEFLFEGEIDLYYMKEPNVDRYFLDSEGQLIVLDNEEIIDFDEYGGKYAYDSNRHRNVLAYLFREYPDLVKDVQSINLDHKPLINIAKKYHYRVCEGTDCIDYTKSMKTVWYIEPYMSIDLSWLGIENSHDKTTSINPALGANFRFASSRGHYLWNFVTGIKISMNNFSDDFVASIYSDNETTYRIEVKYGLLSVPLKVEYYLPVETFQPYFSVGYSNTFLYGADYEVRKVYYSPPMVGVPIETEFHSYHGGILIGAGARKKLRNNNFLYLRCEYEYRKPLINTRYLLEYINVSSFNISLGYALGM